MSSSSSPRDVPVQSTLLGQTLNIRTTVTGSGPPLLLLHGYPQTGRIWNKVVPRLSERFTVVVTDLRGYGASAKPKGSASHEEYSKREMASDQVQVMKSLGFDTFHIVAHDRGARVAHRLALDHPKCVERMMLLDICPTLKMYEDTDMAFAVGYFHWFALLKPGMENVLTSAPDAYWDVHTGGRATGKFWSDEDVEEYKQTFRDAESAHATCEDYRAAATIDLEHDRASRSAGQKLSVRALRILWGNQGMIQHKWPDAVGVWKAYCEGGVDVSGRAVEGGHYIPEERPDELVDEVLAFFGQE